ncbi:MAG: leucine-rich repeat domain-containing protein [Thermoguttaceae bacterium]|nr:leucine-rich repeat domain-containing protein [Thermoguttaceae bacterium]
MTNSNSDANKTKKRRVKIKASKTEIDLIDLVDETLSEIWVSPNNPTYSSIDGVLYSKDGTELLCFPPASEKNTFQIPDTVTSIGKKAFKGCRSLTEITIPNSVTSIGEWAFVFCTSLTEITIPDSVTSIEKHAFGNCTSLTEITIPDSVTSMAGTAFLGCTSLNHINVSPNNPSCSSIDGVLYSKDGTELLCFPPASEKNAFQIPDSVTSIGEEAFCWCRSLTDITIPDSVTSIGERAFSFCSSLTAITIPDSVTSIGRKTFERCTSLTKITIPDSVSSIGVMAFSSCTSLTEITIPDSVTTIENWAFSHCTSLTEITIPNSVTLIGEYVFYECTSLTKATILASVTSISGWTFWGCTSLTEITIPNSVTSIGYSAFLDCSSLTEITIPDSVTTIMGCAFYGCTSLTKITIPDSVTSIGDCAFKSCPVTIIATPGSYAWKFAQRMRGIKTDMTRTTISFDDYDPSDLNDWDDIRPYNIIIDECVGEDESTCPVSIDEIQDYIKTEDNLTRKVKLHFIRTACLNGIVFWLWKYRVGRVSSYLSVIREPDGRVILGNEDTYDLTPEQFLVCEYYIDSDYPRPPKTWEEYKKEKEL